MYYLVLMHDSMVLTFIVGIVYQEFCEYSCCILALPIPLSHPRVGVTFLQTLP